MRARALVAALAVVLVASACSNAASSKQGSDTTLPVGGPTSTVSAADLKKNVPVSAPGVSSTEIDVATIVTKTNNPTGASYGPLVDGIKAYFKMVNDNGGIYGRKLVVKYDHDDQFNNRKPCSRACRRTRRSRPSSPTRCSPAPPLLARAKQPTFVWNINPEFAGTPDVLREHPRHLLHVRGPHLSRTSRRS